MDENLRRRIRTQMQGKNTDELVEIWKRNDHTEWADETFEIIREILQDRIGVLPAQDVPKNVDLPSSQKLSLWQVTVGIGLLLLWLVFMILETTEFNSEYLFGLLPRWIQQLLVIVVPPGLLGIGLWELRQKILKQERVLWITITMPLVWGVIGLLTATKIRLSPEANNAMGYFVLLILFVAVVADLIGWLSSFIHRQSGVDQE